MNKIFEKAVQSIKESNYNVLKECLDVGKINENDRSPITNLKNDDGYTLLDVVFITHRYPDTKFIKLLIDNGANGDDYPLNNEYKRPIDLVSEEDRKEIEDLLFNNISETDITDSDIESNAKDRINRN
ncbi:hypothetical protein [Wolbachia endosymbiont of Pentidionis agamae]|uniref:hypothetical protein n=1 Tax=Wolbachia endosymbiont of Pentidionis agamae TaxID=3110435 RepID=UPI002FD2E5C4